MTSSVASFSLAMVLEATHGQLLAAGASSFAGFSTDSRQTQAGQVFIALRGPRFDGHDHLQQALAAGATGLMVSRPLPEKPPAGITVVQVPDTRLALGQLAQTWRRKVAPTVVAVTGSVGKTTTKELIRSVLEQRGPTHGTPGNFNNDIGLPLTILAMPPTTRYLVVEMGMNAPGEIAYLTQLAEPEVGVITCIAPVHLAGLGSMAAIAAAKGELLRGLPADGWAVVPGGEPLLAPHLQGIAPQRRVTFGQGVDDDVRLMRATGQGLTHTQVELELRGELLQLTLPLAGKHNALNACAAAAVGLVLGLDQAALVIALSIPPRLEHRSTVRELGDWIIFDDCYNANPVAVKAALDTLAQSAAGQPTIAVLGSMLELGPAEEQFHQEVGEHAAQQNLAALITVGPLAAAMARGARRRGMSQEQIVEVDRVEAAVQALRHHAPPGARILIKASRGAHLEKIIELLEQDAEEK